MAYTTIDDPSAYFQNKAYTGGSGDTAHTFDGNSDMQPDLVWIKNRGQTDNHALIDSVRGSRKWLGSNVTDQEDSNNSAYLASFNSDGFTTSDTDVVGKNGETYASWNWKAGTSFTNDASATGIGSIDSTGSVNTTSGFSIVSYTGTGSAGTIKHGLSTTPKMIIQKNRDEAQPWWTYVESIGAGGQLRLNDTNAEGSDGGVLWNSTAPTSSVFSVGDNTGTNGSSDKCIAYCFAEKQGYSKFGSYTGNGNADGTFVYTGFKPAMIICKNTGAAQDWIIKDNTRDIDNPVDDVLYPNGSYAEDDGATVDFLSNGFKCRTTAANTNQSGNTFIYMAFAENPFVTSTGVPATAR